MSLANKTTTGVLWNLAEQFARRGVNVLTTLLLARFLVPEDFGLVAMMAVFITLGQSLMDSGFREALIRLESISQTDYATAFYANVMLGCASYGLLYVTAPLVSEFYGEPRLTDLIRVASLTIIVMSFQVVQVASLSRKLNFKAQLRASFPASILSGVLAVFLAYFGMGVWALVFQMILNALIHTLLLWFTEGWRPTRQFNWPSLKSMYRFGYKLFISGALDTVFQNLYIIVIAKIFSAPIAGLYFFSSKIRDLIVQQVVQAIQKVTYPALASLQSEDYRLKSGFKKIIILMTSVLFPVTLFVAVLAEPLFELFLPKDWHPAIPYFQLLCCASVMLPLHSVNVNILKVKGRSDLFLLLEIVKKLVNALVLLSTYSYGIYAIILGQIAASFINYIPNSYLASKVIDYKIREQLVDFSPTLFIAALSAGMGLALVNALTIHPLIVVLIVSALMGSVFIAGNYLFNRRVYDVVFQYFSDLVRGKKNENPGVS